MNRYIKLLWPSGLRHSPCKRKIVSSILIVCSLYILSFFKRNIKYNFLDKRNIKYNFLDKRNIKYLFLKIKNYKKENI